MSAGTPDGSSNLEAGGKRAARIVVISDHAGQRIDNYLHSQLASVPKSRLYKMLRSGEVRVNGGRKKPVYRLKAGDKVRIPPHHAGPERAPAFVGAATLSALEAAIIFEDSQLLVVNKPAGLAVHGGSGVEFGLIEAMRRLRGNGIELVHRLDRDTSGVLLLAKKRSALKLLHDLIRSGSVDKYYRLIVHGSWPKHLNCVRLPLRKFQTASGERRVTVAADGKPSETQFRLLEKCGRASLLEAELLTGRTHQIRVHTQASGHPIIGDLKYAPDAQLQGSRRRGIKRLCLHAQRLELPWDGQRLSFDSPIPADMIEAWNELRAVGSDREA